MSIKSSNFAREIVFCNQQNAPQIVFCNRQFSSITLPGVTLRGVIKGEEKAPTDTTD